ncbi:MAG: putative metal-binding motif-containing protein [Alphaproteobacteria bacterium]|nr:putative metal-binding motif-containing protein [Alphaproteobacteria bacterium]
MTWDLAAEDTDAGTVTVSCHAGDGCSAYVGDTACSATRAVLCVQEGDALNPNGASAWTGDQVATSPPIAGCQLATDTSADAWCAATLGTGWRMARFHDAGGWSLSGLGDWDATDRVWVGIGNQPANCWNTDADNDGDGASASDDCNDHDPDVQVVAPETCNGVDDDCDGVLDLSEWDFTDDGLPDCTVGTCTGDGMTWGQTARDANAGTVTMSCWAGAGCDAYDGDATCAATRPLLCVRSTAAANPGVSGTWFAGEAALATGISGCQLTAMSAGDDVCAGWFGDGWRMAEHHDGGFGFTALGAFDTTERAWVGIDDTTANCWD